jgi:hypothetical protein
LVHPGGCGGKRKRNKKNIKKGKRKKKGIEKELTNRS